MKFSIINLDIVGRRIYNARQIRKKRENPSARSRHIGRIPNQTLPGGLAGRRARETDPSDRVRARAG